MKLHLSARRILFLVFVALLGGCEALPTQAPVVAPQHVRGMTLVSWYRNGYSQGTAQTAIERIKNVGATHLVIMLPAYQKTTQSSTVRADSLLTPTPESVQQALTWARDAGLQVILKPHVLVDDGSWSGRIQPQNVAEWFQSYFTFLEPWLALALTYEAPCFVVGTELAGTVTHESLWRRLIGQIRDRFTGQLTYAASWDEAEKVTFWDALDFVGIDFYFPISRRNDAGRLEILSGWQPWLNRLERLHLRAEQDLLLTEIGYRSVDGAGLHPYRFGEDGVLDLQEQADLYWAALQATSDAAWIAGLFWWNWPADGSGGLQNTDFTPAGKPAETELASSWK